MQRDEPAILEHFDERLVALNDLDRPTREDIVAMLTRLETATRDDAMRPAGAYAAVDPDARDREHEGRQRRLADRDGITRRTPAGLRARSYVQLGR